MDTVNVLILYGGEAATKPRDELLDWLNSPALHRQIGKRVDARKVAAMVAHMEGSIDQRVEDMMNWAHKGIFLLTPDPRSKYGAPNVVEEFGRWIGQKGRRSMLTLRHNQVEVHSNASGLVYVGFKENVIEECEDKLVAFINDHEPSMKNPDVSKTSAPTQPNSQTINSGQTFNIGSVGGNLTGGDSIGGNVYHISGDFNMGSPLSGSEVGKNANKTDWEDSSGEPKTVTLFDLRNYLNDHYNKPELDDLCLEMRNIETGDFPTAKSQYILEFLKFLKRRDRLEELLDVLASHTGNPFEKKLGKRSSLQIEI